MKKIFILFIIVFLIVSCSDGFSDSYRVKITFPDSTDFVIMSQNLRYADDYLSSNERADCFVDLLKLAKPDIIGTQECTATWKDKLSSRLGKIYGTVGISRDGKYAVTGEWNLILYRRDRFKLVDHGDFWLTDTPYVVSKVSGADCRRICTWAVLHDKFTDKDILMCNTHLDQKLNDAGRMAQLQVIFDFIGTRFDSMPVFLTGDFNCSTNTSTLSLAQSKLSVSCLTAKNNASTDGTYNGFGTKNNLIDFCLYNSAFSSAEDYRIWSDNSGTYYSDHWAITTKFSLK